MEDREKQIQQKAQLILMLIGPRSLRMSTSPFRLLRGGRDCDPQADEAATEPMQFHSNRVVLPPPPREAPVANDAGEHFLLETSGGH